VIRNRTGGPGVVGLGGGNESEETYDLAAYHADFDKVEYSVAGVGVVGRTKYEAAGGLFESYGWYGVVARGKRGAVFSKAKVLRGSQRRFISNLRSCPFPKMCLWR
jgi:hypothetical protein